MTENKTDKLDKILDKLISRFEFRILPPVSPAYRKDKIEQTKLQILAEVERKALKCIPSLSVCQEDTKMTQKIVIRRNEEYHLQCQVAKYLQLQYSHIVFTAHLGGVRVGIGLAMKLKRMGYCTGMPDIEICCGRFEKDKTYIGLMLELKTETGSISKVQNDLHRRLREAGYMVKVCRTLDDTVKVITEYLS